jgi:hypothetical protein
MIVLRHAPAIKGLETLGDFRAELRPAESPLSEMTLHWSDVSLSD